MARGTASEVRSWNAANTVFRPDCHYAAVTLPIQGLIVSALNATRGSQG